MNDRFRFDSQDPFGSRPDEKPPAGWDARFWDEVLERIEQRRVDPGSRRLPRPPGRGTAAEFSFMVVVALIMATAAGTAYYFSASLTQGRPVVEAAGPKATVVRVSGAAEPGVAVEWARSEGQQSGYVVLESTGPEISYVLIDRRLEDQGTR